jgi:Kef-type K+ transport system membrane component KefB
MSSNFHLALHLFLQLAVILLACRLTGRALRFLGQPQVVGEMDAGILLGPSLLGLVAPGAREFLFPTTLTIAVGGETPDVVHPSMTILYALAQLGLVLYMFLVGLQLDRGLLLHHSRNAVSISVSGILVPVVMGGLLGAALATNSRLFPPEIAPWQTALFLASAMCITAFPMLARILHESGVAQTRVGTLALGAAAFDDAAAWCLLACVIATLSGSAGVAVLAIAGGGAYALAMIFIGRPLLRRFERTADGGVRGEVLATVLLILLLCAWITDWVGIHAVFGAFVLGAVMPRGAFAQGVQQSVENLTVTLLLPVFFVYSGLSTRMGVLIDPSLFWLAVGIIAVAFACKGGGCLLAARLAGSSWREATALGVLMNARGMMELILVNIARERGLITGELFTILVLMALVTTLIASPLFHVLYPRGGKHEPVVGS